MAQMNISLPEKLREWVETRVAQGRFSSASDYVRHLIRRDEEIISEFEFSLPPQAVHETRNEYVVERDDRHAETLARLRDAIAKGRESGPSGKSLQDVYDDFIARRDAG